MFLTFCRFYKVKLHWQHAVTGAQHLTHDKGQNELKLKILLTIPVLGRLPPST